MVMPMAHAKWLAEKLIRLPAHARVAKLGIMKEADRKIVLRALRPLRNKVGTLRPKPRGGT